MRKVYVLGAAMTPFGVSKKTNMEMFADASLAACEDSGLAPREIQALFVGNVLGDFEEGQINMASFLAAEMGLPPEVPAVRIENACASSTVAIRNAALLVASGIHDVVLAGGTERTTVMGTPLATRAFAMGSHSRYEEPTGITFPGIFAMAAHLYADKYSIPLDVLKRRMALVAVKNHRNGSRNPLAHFRKEITVDTVLESTMVADPLQLYDCCPFSDGAAALVLAAGARFRPRRKRAVAISGLGQAAAGSMCLQKDVTRSRAREASARQAYRMAGVGPGDVDVCELHDCFTIAEILATEGLGFFEFGKGGEAVERGETSLTGRIPVNPSGGLKAKGHPIGATGAAQAYEIVKQLRGECGERQVEGAAVGLVDTLGGEFGTVCTIVFGR